MKRSVIPTSVFMVVGVLGVFLVQSGSISQTSWQPQHLSPVQKFARVSEPADADEGNYRKLDSFLSTHGFSAAQPLGAPGQDAPPQPLRRHPYGLAMSADETKLYVTAPGNEGEPGNRVLVIGTRTGTLSKEIPVGSRPWGITLSPSGRYLVVTNQYSNYLSVVDTRSDAEVFRIPTFYYAQKVAFVSDRKWLLVTNRALDALDIYSYDEQPLSASFLSRIPLSVANRPFMLDDDPGYGLGGEHQILQGSDPGFSNTWTSTPGNLVRNLTNVNPRDLVVAGNYVYIANVGGLGVSVVDLNSKAQVASIDLNAPALDVVAVGPLVFVSTLGRFIQGFDDVHNEIGVIDTRADPKKLRMRYTSSKHPPYGPPLGPSQGNLVPPTGDAPYLSAFGVANFANFPKSKATFLTIVDGFPTNPDNLPQLVDGALPDQMLAVEGRLIVADSASDQIEVFAVDGSASSVNILHPVAKAFTNPAQVAFPDAINTRALFDDGPYLFGKDNPGFFQGRLPQEMAFAGSNRRLYVANRLGEGVAVFQLDTAGKPSFERFIELNLPDMPQFPATLAEVGEDFYMTSRVSLNRDISCLSCHPDLSTDSKIWHVGSTPGRGARLTLTNRNLRDTAPFYRSAIRNNLEDFRGTFRVMSPEGPFGFFEVPAPFDANGDGVLNDKDRGRTVADVNRNRTFALERTGVGFEKTSSAIAAFLEAEIRLTPNPFRTPDKQLSSTVQVGVDPAGNPLMGDAIEGQKLFSAAGCESCHSGPAFTNNEVLSLEKGTMADMDADGIPDGVTLSVERTLFDRLPMPWERYRSELIRERIPFTSVDTDRRLNFANSANTFTPADEREMPRSAMSGRLLIGLTANTRNVNVPSLRGVWDLPAMLQNGRAVSPLHVLSVFNNIGKHGDPAFLGKYDISRGQFDQKYLNLAAYLKSLE